MCWVSTLRGTPIKAVSRTRLAISPAHGWTNPLLVGPDNVVIAGHARLAAAKRLRFAEVPIIVLGHLTEAQRRALVIADNQLALNAGWDEETLRVELRTLAAEDFDLVLVGFGEPELADLLASAEDFAGHTDEDAVPEMPETAVSVSGDLWILCDHRVYCGDAIQVDAIERVMGSGLASEASRQFGGAHPLLRILTYFLGPFVLNAGQDTWRTLFESSNGRCATSAILESGLYERQ